MTTPNQILGAIYTWLKGLGYDAYLNFSLSRWRPTHGGAPNVTICKPDLIIRVDGDYLMMEAVRSDHYETVATLELSDPLCLDRLQAALEAEQPG